MIINNIKKKKLQNALIFLIILIGVLMFATSLNLINGLNGPFEKNHAKLNGFSNIFVLSNKDYNSEEMIKWFKGNSDVEELSVSNGYTSLTKTMKNGKELPFSFFIQEKKNKDKGMDKLIIEKGTEKKCPDKGEVWLPTTYAKLYKLNIGDKLTITVDNKNIELTVSAWVNDAEFGSTAMTYTRLWVGEGELKEIIPEVKSMTSFSVKLRNGVSEEEFSNEFINYSGKPLPGASFTIKELQYIYTLTLKMIGSVLIAISILIIIFTTIIIGFTISNSILGDAKTIGVLETIGFTKIQSVTAYVLQYILIAILAIPLGLAGSSFSFKILLKDIFKQMGIMDIEASLLQTATLTVIMVITIIGIGTVLSSLKIFKLNVVEAINKGALLTKNKNRESKVQLGHLPVPLALTFKDIVCFKRQSFIMFLLIFCSFFIITISVNLGDAFKQASKNAPFWGFEKCDITLETKGNMAVAKMEELKNIISKDEKIKAISRVEGYSKLAISKYKNIPDKNISAYVYSEDLDKLGMVNLEGRNPKTFDEISLSKVLSEKYEKSVGDYINVSINNKKEDLLITGIFQTAFRAGIAYRINYNKLQALDESLGKEKPNQYSIIVKDKNKIEEVFKNLKASYGDSFEISKGNKFVESLFKPISEPVNSAILLMIISFTIISFVCILNFTVMNIYQNKKNLGIFKAIGVDDSMLISMHILKLLFFSIIAGFTAIPLAIYSGPKLMGTVVKSIGIMEFPMGSNLMKIVIIISITILLFLVSVLIPARKILKINGRELVSE